MKTVKTPFGYSTKVGGLKNVGTSLNKLSKNPKFKDVPSKEEILQEMELHNADEAGINNQWTFEDAEYHLLLNTTKQL